MMNWRRFFSELKRRKVFRATIAYLAVAWLLIQVASVLFPAFEFPAYGLKVLIYVLTLGLPLWMIFSWIYDWTSEGWQKTEDLPEGMDLNPATLRSVLMFSSFLALVVLVGWFIWDKTDEKSPLKINSLAVLPFEDLSGEKDQEAMVVGLQDNLITSLSQIKKLSVISRTSTKRYADTDMGMKEIAAELNVDALIEASMLKIGDSVRINVQLIQVKPQEKHLWAQIFDRPLDSNVLEMFSEVTREVANQIHLELSSEEKRLLSKERKVDPEALKAFLKGKYQLERLSPEGFELAQEYFKKAVDIDPGFAAVYAELANSYIYMLQMRFAGFNEAMPAIYNNFRKAQELDPDLPESDFTMALIKWYEWDWAASEEHFEKFLSVHPDHALANAFYAHLLLILKHVDKAVEFSERAIDLEPRNDLILALGSVVLGKTGRAEEAGELVLRSYKLNPRSILILRGIEFQMFEVGKEKESIEILQTLYGEIYGLDLDLQEVFQQEGYEAALKHLCSQMALHMDNQDLYIGLYQMRLGNLEETANWLVRGYQRHDVDIPYLFTEGALISMINDPRLIDIADKVGLPRH